MILELNKSCRPLQKISPSPLLELAPAVKTLPSNIKESQHALEFFRDLHFLGRKWWPGHTSFHYEYYIFLYCPFQDEGLLALIYFSINAQLGNLALKHYFV